MYIENMGNVVAKDKEEPIGRIKLTEKQEIAIRTIVDMPEWEVVEKWARQRAVNIAVTGIQASTDSESLYYYKGMSHENRQTILLLRQIRDKITKENVPKSSS